MTIDEAFKAGLKLVREAGLPAKGTDIPALAAYHVFAKTVKGKEYDDQFPDQGPVYAKRLIIIAYSR